jgi:hypothetical protein
VATFLRTGENGRVSLTPVEFAPGELYHVRLLPGDAKRSRKHLTLKPKRSFKTMPGEDTKILRVSLATSPGTALASTHEWFLPYQDPRAIHVYANVLPVLAMAPSADLVPDVQHTGEVWCRKPIPMVKIGVVLPGRSRELLLGGYEVADELNREFGTESAEAVPEVAEYFDEMLAAWKGWEHHEPFAGTDERGRPGATRLRCNPPTRPKAFYHVSLTRDEDQILAQGLIPQIGPRAKELGETEPRVFLFPSMEDLDNALYNWLGEELPEEEGITVYEIMLPNGFPVFPTFESDEESWEWYTDIVIPPEFLRVYRREPGIAENPDAPLRELQRQWAQGDANAGAQWILRRIRQGDLAWREVSIAAGLGDEASLLAMEQGTPEAKKLAPKLRSQGSYGRWPSYTAHYLTQGGRRNYAEGALRILLGAVEAAKDLLPTEVRPITRDVREWLKLVGQREAANEAGQQIADKYLDLLEQLPTRTKRPRRDRERWDPLEVPFDEAAEAALHLAHAVGMSSSSTRTRWRWGWQTDRMEDGVLAAMRALHDEGEDEDYERAEAVIRREAVPFVLGLEARRNPDEDLRDLERRWKAGEPEAGPRYVRELERTDATRDMYERAMRGDHDAAKELRLLRKVAGRPISAPQRACFVVEETGRVQINARRPRKRPKKKKGGRKYRTKEERGKKFKITLRRAHEMSPERRRKLQEGGYLGPPLFMVYLDGKDWAPEPLPLPYAEQWITEALIPLGEELEHYQCPGCNTELRWNPEGPVIALVSCVGEKRKGKHEACSLYQSDWFKKARAYVEALQDAGKIDSWAILSAKHGLLPSDRVVGPYDLTLNKMPAPERRKWAAKVSGQLLNAYGPDAHYVVLAGTKYRQYLFTPESGFTYEIPMKGLGIGDQKKWLKKQAAKLRKNRKSG